MFILFIRIFTFENGDWWTYRSSCASCYHSRWIGHCADAGYASWGLFPCLFFCIPISAGIRQWQIQSFADSPPDIPEHLYNVLCFWFSSEIVKKTWGEQVIGSISSNGRTLFKDLKKAVIRCCFFNLDTTASEIALINSSRVSVSLMSHG